ncbi:RICIN domain-containing protein [Streptomyces californicus]|uniref:RICIN domain-containing protein n=1 Tax=Streptomyces TaxID=1883 RepID=UPI0015C4C270|nr:MULTISPECIES: RICIN domain-containing protein [Streptomyces]MBK0372927.1 RICIN domain-containing protein [Streptomyces sp. RB110-1]MBK0390705.1 RICIN domain-containing protein [Streptomyces sp. RB110-2]MCF3170058.1 RICIN domain-containing protein [Streptomyces violaceoruber]MDW4897096.1 RICIN domain-containing protein [Streptomyces californicus]QLG30465.1 RICIN domain-containing protein [Streptomyces sp. CB04723]
MARIARTALAAAAGLAALVGGATTAHAEPNTTYFRFAVEHSGKCLTVAGGSLADGAAAVQSTCTSGDNQLFALKPAGQGQFRIQAKHSGRCLTTSANLDWKVEQAWCGTDLSTQRWRVMLVDMAKDLHQLRPVDQPDYCLTIPDYSTVEGVRPGIGQCQNVSPQRWTVTASAS